jgi:hypothetical protein
LQDFIAKRELRDENGGRASGSLQDFIAKRELRDERKEDSRA